MSERNSRSERLLGADAMAKLAACRVAVFGVGGVGGYVVEALARGGISALELVDSDTVAESNLNRQILALNSTLGMPKVRVAAARARDINPDIDVTARECFFLPETAADFDFSRYDYVVDAIDTISGKVEIITRAQAAGVPVISAMGAGNKLDPTRFTVADIYETSVCPLCRVMRARLRKAGVDRLKVVYSREEPLAPAVQDGEGHPLPGSVSFVPGVMGLIIAGEVIRDLAGIGGR